MHGMLGWFGVQTQAERFVPVGGAALRLGAALVLGGIVGLERELRSRPAGIRTHMMVGLAAALFTIVGFEMVLMGVGAPSEMSYDPVRFVQAITQGVAFLAAGVIISHGRHVKGLTTGASMWLVGAVGVACGAGQIELAALATLLAVAVLTLVRLVETLLGQKDPPWREDD